MGDSLELSFTTDIAPHRNCRRAWAFERCANFVRYNASDVLEGILAHHAMQWMSRIYEERGAAPGREALVSQLEIYASVLQLRGLTLRRGTAASVAGAIAGRLYDGSSLDPLVATVISTARHTEYEIFALQDRDDLIAALPDKAASPAAPAFDDVEGVTIRGVLDLVRQHGTAPVTYQREWVFAAGDGDDAGATPASVTPQEGDIEIWDYKATLAKSTNVAAYVDQMLTYAALYRESQGDYPARCVLFFLNETEPSARLLSIPIVPEVVDAATSRTVQQIAEIVTTRRQFFRDPTSVEGGSARRSANAVGDRRSPVTAALQCPTCPVRFDCPEYASPTDFTDVTRA